MSLCNSFALEMEKIIGLTLAKQLLLCQADTSIIQQKESRESC